MKATSPALAISTPPATVTPRWLVDRFDRFRNEQVPVARKEIDHA